MTSEPPEQVPFRQERHLAPLPIALAAIGVVLAVAIAFVIVGLAQANSPAPVAVTPSPTPAPVPAATAPAPAAAAPRRDPGPNECVDALGDGGTVDLDAASLTLEHSDLVARFTLAAPLPAGGASLGIFAESRDGDTSYQLAASWDDGELDTFFMHDFERDRDTKLQPRDIEWDGTSIVAAFPDDILGRLGDGWRWYAFSKAGGSDADACPGDPLSFDTLTFQEQKQGNSGKD
jgi:hypothetical protein